MKLVRSFITILMVLILFISPILNNITSVKAETVESSASTMTTSMLNFFQQERATLDYNRVARDEYIVYGVFLSNFFIPWSTKLKDLVNDETDESLPKSVAKRFFGVTERSKEIAQLNSKVYKAINDVLAFSSENFELFTSKDVNTRKPLSGELFLEKLAGKPVGGSTYDPNIYGADGSVYMNISDEATKAAIRVLFGIEPHYFIAEDRGFRAIDRMFMDGLGNIWGSYKGASVDDYVLILPAVLNPAVYADVGQTNNFKFPVSNAFVMGATVKVEQDFLNDALRGDTAYYNAASKSTSRYDKQNVTQIVGVYSPFGYIGRSNDMAKGAVSKPTDALNSFISMDRDSLADMANARILISTNVSEVNSDYWDTLKGTKSLTEEQRANLISYLTSTQVFPLKELNQKMFYFNVNSNASSYNAYDNNEGSFSTIDSLLVETNLFHKAERNDGAQSYFTFYSNSSLASPLLRYLAWVRGNSEVDLTEESIRLVTNSGLSDISGVSPQVENFIESGLFTLDSDYDDSASVARSILGGYQPLFKILPDSYDALRIKTDGSWWYLWGNEYTRSSPMLTSKDSLLTLAATSKSAKSSNSTGIFSFGTFGDGTLEKLDNSDKVNIASTYFHNFMTYRLFSFNSEFAKRLSGAQAEVTEYDSVFEVGGERKKFKVDTSIMNDVNNYPGMYWALMQSLLKIGVSEDRESFTDPVPFFNANLPYMDIDTLGGVLDLGELTGTGGLVATDEMDYQNLLRSIAKNVYNLLSTDTSEYRNNLLKSFIDSFFLSAHRTMVGSWTDKLSVSAGGDGAYAASVGLVNMPSISDIPFASWLLSDYVYIYLFLMVVVIFIAFMLFLTGRRTVGQSALTVLILGILLVFPQFLVTNALQLSDTVGNKVFSQKFNYWAILQHQQSEKSLSNVRSSGDELDYITASVMQESTNFSVADSGVRVRWMSPKKDDNFKRLFNEKTASTSLMSNLTVFRFLFNSQLNQEIYSTSNPLASYVYRPYSAIVKQAKTGYEKANSETLREREVLDSILMRNDTTVGTNTERFEAYRSTIRTAVNYSEEEQRIIEAVSIKPPRALVENQYGYRYWALANRDVMESVFRKDYSHSAGLTVTNMEDPFYQTFLSYTESPYYYFYNVFRKMYNNEMLLFTDSLLSKGTFIVEGVDTDVDGKLRDFLDLEGLFTYVVPYLAQANEYVHGWTSVHGRSIQGYNFETGEMPLAPPSEDSGETNGQNYSSEELERMSDVYKKYTSEKQRKEDLEKVWMMYTPWVDSLYDLSASNNADAKVASKKVLVEDPFNPTSYRKAGRDMIFSEADMRAKSYQYTDLTDIERRLQNVLKETYTDLMYLLNYYDFDEDVIMAAGAMSATFNFNREFSEFKVFEPSAIMYPQGYEMKNFNYDAYMSMILANASGESHLDNKDIYEKVLGKTSFLTGILLLIADFIGVILIPSMKIITAMAVLFLSLSMCLSFLMTTPENILKAIFKTLVKPLLVFLGVSLLFTFVVSIFMGDGLSSYVGSRTQALTVSDPTITLLLLCIVELVYVFILFKVLKMLWVGLKAHGISAVFGALELVATTVTSVAKGVTRGGGRFVGGSYRAGRNYAHRRNAQAKHGEMMEALNLMASDAKFRNAELLPPPPKKPVEDVPPTEPKNDTKDTGNGSSNSDTSNDFNKKASDSSNLNTGKPKRRGEQTKTTRGKNN